MAVRSRAHLQVDTAINRRTQPADFFSGLLRGGHLGSALPAGCRPPLVLAINTSKISKISTPGGSSRNQSFKSRPRPFFLCIIFKGSHTTISMKGNCRV